MPPFPPPSHAPVAVTLVIVVAVLIALGMLLRWHHDRQRLAVLKLAIEKGVTHLPAALPMWLSSLRQGIMLTTLGVALLIVGGVAVAMVHSPRPSQRGMPPMAGPPGGMGLGARTMPGGRLNRPGPPGNTMQGRGATALHPPGGPPGTGLGAGNTGHGFATPGAFPPRPGFRAGNGRFPPRGGPGANRGFNPMMSPGFPPPGGYQQRLLGFGALAIGFVLTLLGAARIGFAMVERRYFAADELQSGEFPHGPDGGA